MKFVLRLRASWLTILWNDAFPNPAWCWIWVMCSIRHLFEDQSLFSFDKRKKKFNFWNPTHECTNQNDLLALTKRKREAFVTEVTSGRMRWPLALTFRDIDPALSEQSVTWKSPCVTCSKWLKERNDRSTQLPITFPSRDLFFEFCLLRNCKWQGLCVDGQHNVSAIEKTCRHRHVCLTHALGLKSCTCSLWRQWWTNVYLYFSAKMHVLCQRDHFLQRTTKVNGNFQLSFEWFELAHFLGTSFVHYSLVPSVLSTVDRIGCSAGPKHFKPGENLRDQVTWLHVINVWLP